MSFGEEAVASTNVDMGDSESTFGSGSGSTFGSGSILGSGSEVGVVTLRIDMFGVNTVGSNTPPGDTTPSGVGSGSVFGSGSDTIGDIVGSVLPNDVI